MPAALARLRAAMNSLEKEKQDTAEILARAQQASQKIGLRKLAARAGVDPANLSNVLAGKRSHSARMIAQLQRALMCIDH